MAVDPDVIEALLHLPGGRDNDHWPLLTLLAGAVAEDTITVLPAAPPHPILAANFALELLAGSVALLTATVRAEPVMKATIAVLVTNVLIFIQAQRTTEGGRVGEFVLFAPLVPILEFRGLVALSLLGFHFLALRTLLALAKDANESVMHRANVRKNISLLDLVVANGAAKHCGFRLAFRARSDTRTANVSVMQFANAPNQLPRNEPALTESAVRDLFFGGTERAAHITIRAVVDAVDGADVQFLAAGISLVGNGAEGVSVHGCSDPGNTRWAVLLTGSAKRVFVKLTEPQCVACMHFTT